MALGIRIVRPAVSVVTTTLAVVERAVVRSNVAASVVTSEGAATPAPTASMAVFSSRLTPSWFVATIPLSPGVNTIDVALIVSTVANAPGGRLVCVICSVRQILPLLTEYAIP